MRKNVKGIVSKIIKKQDLEMNLPLYATELTTDYYQFALVGLTMNYYILYEMTQENQVFSKDHIAKSIENINDIIKKGIIDDFDGVTREKCISAIEILRNDVMEKMDIIVDYVEKFMVYQYVLNRIEYRFNDSNSETAGRNISDEETASEIFRYIFANKDNMIINDKIKMIVGQLPVRMAKSKFFDIVTNSITLYNGADIASLESFLYMIRSSAMLYKPKGYLNNFTDIKDELNYFENIDYTAIDEDTFKDVYHRLSKTSSVLNSFSDAYCALMDVINKTYVILLEEPYANGSDLSIEDNNICKDIINHVFEYFNADEIKDIEDSITAKLSLIEGRQETIHYNYSQLEAELFPISTDYTELIESLMLSHQYECLKKCQVMLSSSSFVELSDNPEFDKIADKEYIENVQGKMISELSDLFASVSTPIRRAIMANVLNKLPVFFVNSNEIVEYVKSSLSSCRDEAEKNASIDLIREMMYDDDYVDEDMSEDNAEGFETFDFGEEE